LPVGSLLGSKGLEGQVQCEAHRSKSVDPGSAMLLGRIYLEKQTHFWQLALFPSSQLHLPFGFGQAGIRDRPIFA
jgi:hypothetical protein